jgi:ferredoxin/flavodoxin---NADP+ reductase
MVLRSVGYQSVPLPGVPFDERSYTVPNAEGRVLGPDGNPQPGEYVAGWLKRGPTGVIGTNKSDAAETVRSLFADLGTGGAEHGVPAHTPAHTSAHALDEMLASRGVRLISYGDWLAIEKREAELAAELGRGERVKLAGWDALLAACGAERASFPG